MAWLIISGEKPIKFMCELCVIPANLGSQNAKLTYYSVNILIGSVCKNIPLNEMEHEWASQISEDIL